MEKETKFRKKTGNMQDGLKSGILQSLVEQWYRWYRGTVKVPTGGMALENHTGSIFKIYAESNHFLQFYYHKLCLGFLQKSYQFAFALGLL